MLRFLDATRKPDARKNSQLPWTEKQIAQSMVFEVVSQGDTSQVDVSQVDKSFHKPGW